MNIGDAVDFRDVYSDYLTEPDGSRNLAVDGSTTPVVFKLDVPDLPGQNMAFFGLGIALNSNSAMSSGDAFLDDDALINGLAYGLILRETGELQRQTDVIKTNMDIFSQDPGVTIHNMSGNDEAVSFTINPIRSLVFSCQKYSGVFIEVADDLTIMKGGAAYCSMHRVTPSKRG